MYSGFIGALILAALAGVEQTPTAPPVYDQSYKPHPPGPGASSSARHKQAGFPICISRWAVPSDTGHFTGYWVGGGNPFWLKADPPGAVEGTWGWDYRGWLFQRRVILGWWHGRRHQGGTGAYATDGPGANHGEAGIHRK